MQNATPVEGVEMKICTANITNKTLQKLNFRKMSYEGQHITTSIAQLLFITVNHNN